MPYLNVKDRVLEVKIVYYGAGLSGKTTNLEKVKKLASAGRVGEMMSLNTDGDRTLFFDYLPFELGKFNGCDVKVQLYTVPGQAKYAETRKRVLANADGVVMVLDSQAAALDRNRQTLADLEEHLEANGLPPTLPMVVQLNKRDLPDAMAPQALLEAVGLADYDAIEAVASEGRGVFETLRAMIAEVLRSIRNSAQEDDVLEAGEASGLDGSTLHRRLVDPEGASATPKEEAPAPAESTSEAASDASSREEAAPSASQNEDASAPSMPRIPSPKGLRSLPSAPPVAAPPRPPEHRRRPSAGGAVVAMASMAGAESEQEPAVGGPVSAELREVRTHQRTLARRMDTLEANLRKLTLEELARLASDQKKLFAGLRSQLEDGRNETEASEKLEALAESLTASQERAEERAKGLEQRLEESMAAMRKELAASLGEGEKRTLQQGQRIADQLSAALRLVRDAKEGHDGLSEALGTQFGTIEELANRVEGMESELFSRTDALTTKLESVRGALSSVRELAGDLTTRIERMNARSLEADKKSHGLLEGLQDDLVKRSSFVSGLVQKRIGELETRVGAVSEQLSTGFSAVKSGIGDARDNLQTSVGQIGEATAEANEGVHDLRKQLTGLGTSLGKQVDGLGAQLPDFTKRLDDLRGRVEALQGQAQAHTAKIGRGFEAAREHIANLGERLIEHQNEQKRSWWRS